MYDILQLNDMLVPELLDIAEQLHIPHAKKSDKQELIYKILDKQAVSGREPQQNGVEKPKRKRITKAKTANTTEDAEIMTEEPSAKQLKTAEAEDSDKEKQKKKGRKPKEKETPPAVEEPKHPGIGKSANKYAR